MTRQSKYARIRTATAMLEAFGASSNPQQSLAPKGAGIHHISRSKPRQSERQGYMMPSRVERSNRMTWRRQRGVVHLLTPSADGTMSASSVQARPTPPSLRLEFGSKAGIYFSKPIDKRR